MAAATHEIEPYAGRCRSINNYNGTPPRHIVAQLAVTTAMLELGDIIPFAPAHTGDRVVRFAASFTEIDTNASPLLVMSLVLTTAPFVAFASKTDYNVITAITHDGAATYNYSLDAATNAIQIAAKMKYVGAEKLSWALLVTTAPATAAAGTILITMETSQWTDNAGLSAFS